VAQKRKRVSRACLLGTELKKILVCLLRLRKRYARGPHVQFASSLTSSSRQFRCNKWGLITNADCRSHNLPWPGVKSSERDRVAVTTGDRNWQCTSAQPCGSYDRSSKRFIDVCAFGYSLPHVRRRCLGYVKQVWQRSLSAEALRRCTEGRPTVDAKVIITLCTLNPTGVWISVFGSISE